MPGKGISHIHIKIFDISIMLFGLQYLVQLLRKRERSEMRMPEWDTLRNWGKGLRLRWWTSERASGGCSVTVSGWGDCFQGKGVTLLEAWIENWEGKKTKVLSWQSNCSLLFSNGEDGGCLCFVWLGILDLGLGWVESVLSFEENFYYYYY